MPTRSIGSGSPRPCRPRWPAGGPATLHSRPARAPVAIWPATSATPTLAADRRLPGDQLVVLDGELGPTQPAAGRSAGPPGILGPRLLDSSSGSTPWPRGSAYPVLPRRVSRRAVSRRAAALTAGPVSGAATSRPVPAAMAARPVLSVRRSAIRPPAAGACRGRGWRSRSCGRSRCRPRCGPAPYWKPTHQPRGASSKVAGSARWQPWPAPRTSRRCRPPTRSGGRPPAARRLSRAACWSPPTRDFST